MRLILADQPNLSAVSMAAITAALASVQQFQKLFQPGQPLAVVGQYVNQLIGSDAAERARYEALIPVVKNDLDINYRSLTGQPLWNPFTPEKSQWLQIAINQQVAVASNNYTRTGDRVALRYVKVYQQLTEENRIRLEQAQRNELQPANENLQKAGLAIAAAGLLSRFL